MAQGDLAERKARQPRRKEIPVGFRQPASQVSRSTAAWQTDTTSPIY
jgi:hypothetical protein